MSLFAQITSLESLLDEKGNVNTGLIESYLETIPEKAIHFGVKVILAIIVLFIGFKLIKWIRKIVTKACEKGKADKGVIQFLDALIKTVLTVVLLITVASKFGLEVTSIITVLGSAGIAIGLALQGSLSNFAGGVLILLLKPFKVGDYIIEDTKKNEGKVAEISLFYTKLITYDERVVILPNGSLANNSMTNVTGKDRRKIDIRVTISYDADIRKARELIMNLMNQEKMIIQKEDKIVFVDELADSGVILGIRCFVKSKDFWDLKWKLTEEIKYIFDENNIVIPYPQMDVHMIGK